jgi:hypothetical protein
MKMKCDVYYFNTYEAARSYALEFGWPTDRIISYEPGWAIQIRKSGPYVGPGEIERRKAA